MPTENHSLNTPGKGATDWDVPLNENSTMLDQKVEVRDTDANLDNYEPKDGAKYFATDTGDVYLGDGASWNHLTNILPLHTRQTDSGDGAATAFTITHSLGRQPDSVQVQPTSADANGAFYVDITDADSFDIVYETAPANGTDNLTWDISLH